MKELAILLMMVTLNIGYGIFHRLVYSPRVKTMHNLRTQSLATPIIGVICNSIPYLLWVALVHDNYNYAADNEKTSKRMMRLLMALMVYLMSFMWYGAGVVIGMLIGDARKDNNGEK